MYFAKGGQSGQTQFCHYANGQTLVYFPPSTKVQTNVVISKSIFLKIEKGLNLFFWPSNSDFLQ